MRLGLGGAAYEIDLSTKNAAAFRGTLAPFTGHSRTAGRAQRRRPGAAGSWRTQRIPAQIASGTHGRPTSSGCAPFPPVGKRRTPAHADER